MTDAQLRAVLARRLYDHNTRAYWYLAWAFARQAITLRSWRSALWAARDFSIWLRRKVMR